MNKVYGYKVFELDWTCRGFQYEVGKTFEEDVIPSCCSNGFHFCKELKDCFNYYPFNPDNKVAKVVALGELDEESDGSKCCTNKIQILEEISWEDVLRMVNLGKGNTGLRNSGNWNSGNWNNTNFSNGCFNTEESKIFLFNKPSDWTYHDWLNSDARCILNHMPQNRLKWVNSNDITEEEKKSNLSYKTTGGYLKKIDAKVDVQNWWDNLSENNKNIVMSLPNFDADIFYECTGIKIKVEV